MKRGPIKGRKASQRRLQRGSKRGPLSLLAEGGQLARHELNQRVLDLLKADFDEHGAEVIERVRNEKPEKYLDFVAKVLPHHDQLDVAVGGTVAHVHGSASDGLELLRRSLASWREQEQARTPAIEGRAVEVDEPAGVVNYEVDHTVDHAIEAVPADEEADPC